MKVSSKFSKRIPSPVYQGMSVAKFVDSSDIFDLNPIHQRLPVEGDNLAKSKSIIASMIRGVGIGQLTVHVVPEFRSKKTGYMYESIDGGHRCRAIIGFKRGQFCLGLELGPEYEGKYYHQLSEEDRNFFDNIELLFAIYTGLTPNQVGQVFEIINTGDHVTHQEKMNAAGELPIACAVREMVRFMGRDVGNSYHELFEEHSNLKRKRTPVYMHSQNNRLSYDRLSARVFCIVLNGSKPSACDDIQIEEMYNHEYTQEELNKAKTKVKKCLDFMKMVAQNRVFLNQTKLTFDHATVLFRLYFTYEQRYKNWRINDYRRFNNLLQDAIAQNIILSDKSGLAAQIVQVKNKNGKTVEKVRSELFKNYLSKHMEVENWERSIDFLEETESMDPKYLIEEGILQCSDSVRNIKPIVKDTVISRQDGKCAIDGKELAPWEIQFDHMTSYKNGGSSDIDNIRATSASYNNEKGSLNADQYDAARSVV